MKKIESECKDESKEKIDELFGGLHTQYQELIDFVNNYTYVIPQNVFGQYQS